MFKKKLEEDISIKEIRKQYESARKNKGSKLGTRSKERQ